MVQGLEHKEVIAGELAAAQPGLGEAYRTLTLLRKYAHLAVPFSVVHCRHVSP
jgi:hypothetical protein